MEYRVLALGDVASETGLALLEKKLRTFKREQRIDFTVVNGENISGTGLTRAQAEDLLAAGVVILNLFCSHSNGISLYYSVIRIKNYPSTTARMSLEERIL